jgi:hypothetical protein
MIACASALLEDDYVHRARSTASLLLAGFAAAACQDAPAPTAPPDVAGPNLSQATKSRVGRYACALSEHTLDGPHRYRYGVLRLPFQKNAVAADSSSRATRVILTGPSGDTVQVANCRIPATKEASDELIGYFTRAAQGKKKQGNPTTTASIGAMSASSAPQPAQPLPPIIILPIGYGGGGAGSGMTDCDWFSNFECNGSGPDYGGGGGGTDPDPGPPTDPNPRCEVADPYQTTFGDQAMAAFEQAPGSLCHGLDGAGSICLDFVIEQSIAGPFIGDGRALAADQDPSLSRVQIRLNPGKPFVYFTDMWASPTCSFVTGKCQGPVPPGGNWGNRVDVAQGTGADGRLTISVTYSLHNAISYEPAIDGFMMFHANDHGSYDIFENRNAYPSVGVYQNVNGEFKTLLEEHAWAGWMLMDLMPSIIRVKCN